MKHKDKSLAKECKTKEQIYKRKGLVYYTAPPIVLTVIALTLWLVWRIELTFSNVTAKLVIVLIFGLLAVFGYINVIRYVIYLIRCGRYRSYVLDTMNDYVRMKQGCSGTGKSSSGTHEATYMSDECKRMLLNEYWLLTNKRLLTAREELDLAETKKAYEFYTAKDAELKAQAEECIKERNNALQYELNCLRQLPNGKDKRALKRQYRRHCANVRRANKDEIIGCVWGLWSNIPIRVGNRMSCTATVRHLLQLDCLPKYSVLFWDEIGNTLSKQGFSQTEITQFIEELFRYPRHYNEMRIIMTEQEGNNVLISTRKNIAFMDYFTEPQKSVMKPFLFKAAKNLIEYYVEERNYKSTARWLVNLYNYVCTMYRNIGFRVFSVLRIGNQEQAGAGQVLTKERKRVAYATLNCVYDDRCYRQGYKAKDNAVNGSVWDKLYLSEKDIEDERELRENLLSKPTIELKQELGLKLSNFDQITLAIAGTDIDYNKVNLWIKKKYKSKIAINKLTAGQVEEILQAISAYKQKEKQDNREKI